MAARFKFLVVSVLSVLALVACAAAQTAAPAEVSVLGIKVPAWVSSLLGIGGTGGLGGLAVFAVLKKKLGKILTLYSDCKLVISEAIDVGHYVKREIQSPDAKKEWNEFVEAVAKTLTDTGDSSLVQKGKAFLKLRIS